MKATFCPSPSSPLPHREPSPGGGIGEVTANVGYLGDLAWGHLGGQSQGCCSLDLTTPSPDLDGDKMACLTAIKSWISAALT